LTNLRRSEEFAMKRERGPLSTGPLLSLPLVGGRRGARAGPDEALCRGPARRACGWGAAPNLARGQAP
jgi:hypothetical protein